MGADNEAVDTVRLVSKPDKLMVMAGSDGGGERGVGRLVTAACAEEWPPTPGGGSTAGEGTVGGGGLTE